jgi:hypothetical protein
MFTPVIHKWHQVFRQNLILGTFIIPVTTVYALQILYYVWQSETLLNFTQWESALVKVIHVSGLHFKITNL